MMSEAQAKFRDRRAAPIDELAAERSRRLYASRDERPARERVLLAMRFLEWSAPREIAEALAIPEGARQARNTIMQAIIRSLIPAGLAERRRSDGGLEEGLALDQYEYRLTVAGVRAADIARAA